MWWSCSVMWGYRKVTFVVGLPQSYFCCGVTAKLLLLWGYRKVTFVVGLPQSYFCCGVTAKLLLLWGYRKVTFVVGLPQSYFCCGVTAKLFLLIEENYKTSRFNIFFSTIYRCSLLPRIGKYCFLAFVPWYV